METTQSTKSFLLSDKHFSIIVTSTSPRLRLELSLSYFPHLSQAFYIPELFSVFYLMTLINLSQGDTLLISLPHAVVVFSSVLRPLSLVCMF